jgi:integrase
MAKPRSLLKGFERAVETVAADPKRRQVIFDEATTGLALIVSRRGKKVFSIVARGPAGKQIWKVLGEPATMTVAEARAKARDGVARIKAGEEPFPEEKPAPAPETFRAVAERFIKRWVDKGGKKQDGVPLRSKREIERHLSAYVYPRWADRAFLSIRRIVVTEMMDELVDNHGAVQADRVLATVAKIFNWYRQYDEDYVPPVIPEMKRSGSYSDRARTRILKDEEIRMVWKACDEIGTFGAFVRVALLTAQRRAKVGPMLRDAIDGQGVWTIPAEAREKANALKLKLSPMALDVIHAQPVIEGNPYVFAGRGAKAFNSYSDGKELLDEKAPIAPPWVIHDLRRTAKSLMARAGVRPDISERTLGHVIKGVEGIYDRHDYFDEKADALSKLAALVERIINPTSGNVVALHA